MKINSQEFLDHFNITKHGLDWPWTKGNISQVLNTSGCYALKRNATSAQYAGMSENRLGDRIMDHFPDEFPNVNQFDWYVTKTIQDARNLEQFLIKLYSPPSND